MQKEFTAGRNRRFTKAVCVAMLFLSFPCVYGQKILSVTEREIMLAKAESFTQHKDYLQALPLYLALDTLEPANPVINYKIGLCYLNLPATKMKSIPLLEFVASELEKVDRSKVEDQEIPVEVFYNLGRAYQIAYRLDDAIKAFEQYKKVASFGDKNFADANKLMADMQIKACNTAKELMMSPLANVTITHLDSVINSSFPEYSPVISADESVLIFTSRRPGGTGNKMYYLGEYYEDIYVSYKRANNVWTQPLSIGSAVNTDYNEASIGLSADGQQLFIFKNDNGDGNIYVCNLSGETWTAPVKLDAPVNTKAWEPSVSISADGNTLYFVSDREGGLGGKDIYKSFKLPNGKWGNPQNLGAKINTAQDDDCPFIHPDGKTLYFSSKGHNTMGGYDVFSSVHQEDGSWSEPVNIGYPINGTDDDVFFVIAAKGTHAYYSSVKPEGRGEQDIYLITLPEEKEVNLVIVKGLVYIIGGTADDNRQVSIELTDKKTGEQVGVFKSNSKRGNYLLVLAPGKAYNMLITKDGYKPHSEDFSTPDENKYTQLSQEIRFECFRDEKGKIVAENVLVNTRPYFEPEVMPADSEEVKDTVPAHDTLNVVVKAVSDTDSTHFSVINPSDSTLKSTLPPEEASEKLFYVQVGAFKKLPPSGLKGLNDVKAFKSSDGYTKYLMGGFMTREEAKRLKKEVQKKGYRDAFVTQLKVDKFIYRIGRRLIGH